MKQYDHEDNTINKNKSMITKPKIIQGLKIKKKNIWYK